MPCDGKDVWSKPAARTPASSRTGARNLLATQCELRMNRPGFTLLQALFRCRCNGPRAGSLMAFDLTLELGQVFISDIATP